MKKRLSTLIFFFLSAVMAAQTYKDVAPIFYSRCTSCHNQFGHFSLQSYSQTLPWTSFIQTDLQNGVMPPWPPDTSYCHYVHERTISNGEKNAILLWISNGAQRGDTTKAPPAPVYTNSYKLNGTPDLDLTMSTYTSTAASNDSYICVAMPTGFTQDRILKAYEVIAGNPKIVHHVIVAVDTIGNVISDYSGTCYTNPGNFNVGAYAPGCGPIVFPSQSPLIAGIRIKAGSKIIMQIHYSPGSAGQVDSTRIRMFFYPPGTSGVRQVYVSNMLKNKQLSIPADSVKLFNAYYPGSGGLPQPISLLAVGPHSHKLATKIESYAFSPTDTIHLIRINHWDFNWQNFYTYPKLVKIPQGYTMYAQHTYDNSNKNLNNPFNPPRLIGWGPGSNDEMFLDAFQWLNYKNGDENINVADIINSDPLLSGLEEQATMTMLKPYAYPNPFNTSVKIAYETTVPSNVTVRIYSMYGTCISVLSDAREQAGIHELQWDGRNAGGAQMPTGTYFYTLDAGNSHYSGKLSLISGN